jgi:hypothetical protein
MQKLEGDMLRAQEVEDIGIAKRLMTQLCNQIINIILKQYAVDSLPAGNFKRRIMALQYACYIQKRYRHRSDAEKDSFVIKLNSMINDENIRELNDNPQTFAQEIATVIRELLTVIKADLPPEYKYSGELIDQIAEISSFDGGTAEISARHYNINVPKLHKVDTAVAHYKRKKDLAEMVI